MVFHRRRRRRCCRRCVDGGHSSSCLLCSLSSPFALQVGGCRTSADVRESSGMEIRYVCVRASVKVEIRNFVWKCEGAVIGGERTQKRTARAKERRDAMTNTTK